MGQRSNRRLGLRRQAQSRPREHAPFRHRRLAHAILPLFLSLGLLGAGELACRLRGLGGYPPVLQRAGVEGSSTWYATSRLGTNRYFPPGPLGAGGMRELHFTSPKPAGTVRIVFLGESAIQGFPQSLPLTNGAFLEAMLRDAWHGKRDVEVLNLGATAVASFPVLCFLGEVFEHAPDLVVLMVGNNEYYGAYGVASLHAAGRSPAGMRIVRWVRGLGLTQWLESLTVPKARPHGTLMEVLGAKHQIRYDDPLRPAAATSLRSNLSAMIRQCVARHVPVIVCTVPTNERGLAPIGADPEPQLPAARRNEFNETLALAEKALPAEPAKAAERARAVIAQFPEGARAHYLLGEALTRLGRHEEALGEYVRARDLDTMPWRATSTAQNAVRAAAREGAVLCDLEATFRAESPGGAIGWELLDDHVHMSLRGQALFARAIVAVMTSMPGRLHVDRNVWDELPSWQAYAERQGHSVYSDYMAANYVRKLFAIGFMRRNNEAAHLRSEAGCDALLARMSDLDRAAVARWGDPSLHGASDRPLEYVVGIYRMKAGDYEAAARLLRFARESVATVTLWRLETTWHLLTCDRHLHEAPTQGDVELLQDAIRTGELLERYGPPGNPWVERYLGLAYNLAGNYGAAVAHLEPAVRAVRGAEGWEVVAGLVDSYLQLGRKEDARRLLDLAIADPEMAAAARRLLRSVDDSTRGQEMH